MKHFFQLRLQSPILHLYSWHSTVSIPINISFPGDLFVHLFNSTSKCFCYFPYFFLSLCVQTIMCTITITNLSVSVNTKHLNWFTEVTCSILCTIPFDKLFNNFKRKELWKCWRSLLVLQFKSNKLKHILIPMFVYPHVIV